MTTKRTGNYNGNSNYNGSGNCNSRSPSGMTSKKGKCNCVRGFVIG
jgi:hypothetical protein